MKINQMEKTTNNQINKQEEIRILSRITPVPDICDHQNVEGQNGYFSLKKGWFVFLTFVFMNHTVQLSQTRVCPSPQYRPINFSSLQFILEWNILFLLPLLRQQIGRKYHQFPRICSNQPKFVLRCIRQ